MNKHIILSINPPPKDSRCECCGEHIKELKSFGKAGDPLVGDFDGAKLLKTFRPMAVIEKDSEDEKKLQKLNKIWKMEADKKISIGEATKILEGEFDKEEYERLNFINQLCNTVGASWECRECIILNNKKYFKKLKR